MKLYVHERHSLIRKRMDWSIVRNWWIIVQIFFVITFLRKLHCLSDGILKMFQWTYLIRLVADGMWIHLLLLVLDVYYDQSRHQFDTDQNCHCHKIKWLVHNQRRQSQRKFALLDRMLFHLGTEIGSLAPENEKTKLLKLFLIMIQLNVFGFKYICWFFCIEQFCALILYLDKKSHTNSTLTVEIFLNLNKIYIKQCIHLVHQ